MGAARVPRKLTAAKTQSFASNHRQTTEFSKLQSKYILTSVDSSDNL